MKKGKGLKILLLLVVALCCAAMAAYIVLVQQVEDHTPPEILFAGEELQLSVKDGEEALMEGVSALDDRDGDVTHLVLVEGVSDIREDRRADVTYAAFDSAGNVAKTKRTVRYVDYEGPTFYLDGPLVFRSSISFDVFSHIHASDPLDGSLDDRIKADLVAGEGSIDDVGLHWVEFRVTNSMGDTARITLPVEVYQSGLYNATVSLTEGMVRLKQGSGFDPMAYLKTIKCGSDEVSLQMNDGSFSVEMESDVNTRVPGTYSVAYTVRRGVYSGYTRLAVIVEE